MPRLAAGISAFILSVSCLCAAQLTVKNPGNLYFPEDRAQVIFRTACKVVAAELHVRKRVAIDFPLVVVMGDPHERYAADLTAHTYTIYLDHWDSAQFAAFSMGLAIQVMIPQDQRLKLVAQILRQSGRNLPISVEALRGRDSTVPAMSVLPRQREMTFIHAPD